MFTKLTTPRWLIFLIDLSIVTFSVILAYFLRFNFEIPEKEMLLMQKAVIFVVGVRALSFILTKTYAGFVRYTSTRDMVNIFLTILAGSVLFAISNMISFFGVNKMFFIPFSVIIIDLSTSTLGLLSFRVLVKIAFMEIQNPTRQKQNVIIFGAGQAGIIAKRAMDRDAGTKYRVLAFIDDNPKKEGKKLEGVEIFGRSELNKLLSGKTVAHVIIAIQNISAQRKQELIEECLRYNTKVLTVPPVGKWINGELSFKQIKKVAIEDLLERDEIKLEEKVVRKELLGKTVLVTGAAGSIGSEIVRQIARFTPQRIVAVDQAESQLYHLELEIGESFRNCCFRPFLCDVNNLARLDYIFETYKPEIVYHAAAYKHVPMMEKHPVEALQINICGTKNVADMAIKHRVSKFVMISTDKAVNPTNVMGASKRLAEVYIQALNKQKQTKFITTRFGNVLGSNGSVIPLFREQIEKGGPVTITHPEVTRYFMTIPEACQLVLEAGVIGKGGEIFIFDMGKSVKIVDLAKKMIQLSRLTLGKDIQIVYTGLRPGEKLFEELLNDRENTLPTHHPQIMIAKVAEYDLEEIRGKVDELCSFVGSSDSFAIVKKFKEVLPEFKSNNSIYEQLDN